MTLVNPSVSAWRSYPSQWAARPICLSVSLMVAGQRVPSILGPPLQGNMRLAVWAARRACSSSSVPGPTFPWIHGSVTLAAVARCSSWLLHYKPAADV